MHFLSPCSLLWRAVVFHYVVPVNVCNSTRFGLIVKNSRCRVSFRPSFLQFIRFSFHLRLSPPFPGEWRACGSRRERGCRKGANVPHDAADEQPQGQVDPRDGEGRALSEPRQRRGVCSCACVLVLVALSSPQLLSLLYLCWNDECVSFCDASLRWWWW